MSMPRFKHLAIIVGAAALLAASPSFAFDCDVYKEAVRSAALGALSSSLNRPIHQPGFAGTLANLNAALDGPEVKGADKDLRDCLAMQSVIAAQEAAANAAVADANRRAAAQQASQEQQLRAQAAAQAEQTRLEQARAVERGELQRQEQSKQNLMAAVSTAVLEGRCDDARAAALQANNLDLAEQAVRLCKPKPPPKVAAGKSAAVREKPAPVAAQPAKKAVGISAVQPVPKAVTPVNRPQQPPPAKDRAEVADTERAKACSELVADFPGTRWDGSNCILGPRKGR